MYHRYMIVSQRHLSDGAAEGLSWLQRELEWEQVLGRLRRAAGVPGAPAADRDRERPAA